MVISVFVRCMFVWFRKYSVAEAFVCNILQSLFVISAVVGNVEDASNTNLGVGVCVLAVTLGLVLGVSQRSAGLSNRTSVAIAIMLLLPWLLSPRKFVKVKALMSVARRSSWNLSTDK